MSSSTSRWITFYNPSPIKITQIGYRNYYYSTEGVMKSGTIYASNNNSTWTTLKSVTNNTTTKDTTWYIDLSNNTSFYKYYKIECSTISSGNWVVQELYLTGKYLTNTLNVINLPLTFSNINYGVGFSYIGGSTNVTYISSKTTSTLNLADVDSSSTSASYIAFGY